MTFLELMEELNLEIFPDRLAENLQQSVRSTYKEVLAELQRAVDVLQGYNVDVHPFRADYFKCGTTVICAPAGEITRLYTVGDDFCEPLTYPRVDYDDLYAWSRRFTRDSGIPDNTGLPTLGLGFKYPKDSTDQQYGRALRGCYAYHKGNIYVAPWIQSFESVVIEWNGIKRTWSDADLVSAGPLPEATWRQAIKAWVFAQKCRYWDKDPAQLQMVLADYREAVANLIEDARHITVQTLPSYEVPADRCMVQLAEARRFAALTAAGQTSPPTEVPSLIAFMGDYGEAGPDELAVAELIKGWGSDILVTGGDANYPDGAANTIDANNGQYYRNLIKDYQGSYPLWTGETDAVVNRMFPALGNHDLTVYPPTPFTDYFPALPGNRRFYTFIWGLTQWWVLDSGINTAGNLVETAGNSAVSAQAAWLQAGLAASVAKFKFVAWHHPGYTSDISYYPGIVAMRSLTAQLKGWGVDALFNSHGHQMEHILLDGLNIFVNGAGGAPLRSVHSPPVDGSLFTYTTLHGAIKISVLCAAVTVSFYNVLDVLLYSVEITNTNPVLQPV